MLIRPGRFSPYRGTQRPLWPFTVNRDSPQFAGPGYTLVSWWPMMPFVDAFDIAGNDPINLTNNGPTAAGDSLMGNVFNFVAASSQFFDNNGQAAVIAYPFTFTTWFKANDADSNYSFVFVGDADGATFFSVLQARGDLGGDPLVAFSGEHGGAASKRADSTVPFIAGQWHHGAGVWTSASSRAVFLDGGNKGTNSETVDPIAGYDRTTVGANGFATPGQHMDGQLAEARIYQGTVPDLVIFLMFQPSTRWELYNAPRGSVFLGALEPEKGIVASQQMFT